MDAQRDTKRGKGRGATLRGLLTVVAVVVLSAPATAATAAPATEPGAPSAGMAAVAAPQPQGGDADREPPRGDWRLPGVGKDLRLPRSADGRSVAKAAAAWVNITSDYSGRAHTYQCLDVDINGGGANGSKVQVWQCNGESQQLWYWWDDYFLESARYPGKCLDADLNGGGANGTKLQLWDCNNTAQQQFFRLGGGDVAIYNARFYNNANTVVDRNATVAGNGAGVQLWQKNFQSQQWWTTWW